jgi:uncharacterized protein YidB (DUF937 family)
MFDSLVNELSERYGLGDRGRDLFGLLVAYIHNDRRGGFGGFIEGFREQGHGELLSSWLGNPEAGGLTASDVGTVFGQGLLNDWGTRLGASRATIAAAIAGVLPRLVAELTPGGRIPGGFGAATPLAAVAREDDASGVGTRPRADGLIAGAGGLSGNESAYDPGYIVPGEERRPFDGPARFEPPQIDPRPSPVTSQPLRREPSFAPESPAVRSPVDVRREHESTARTPLDPAEQRLADMAAAFDRPAHANPTDADAVFDARGRPDTWRPAVHPPRKDRRGAGWLFWLIVLLALIAGAGWYVWAQGLLDPYIQRYQLPIRTSPSTT